MAVNGAAVFEEIRSTLDRIEAGPASRPSPRPPT